MGSTGFSFEFTSPVAPTRIFKAALDEHKLAPKVMPEVVSSAELVHGDGGVGSVVQFKFTEAVPFSYVKERLDVIDEEKLEYKYSIIEGADLGTKVVSAVYHVKVGPSGDGGSVYKMTAEYKLAPGASYTDEEMKEGKEGYVGIYKALEGYLLENPQAYA